MEDEDEGMGRGTGDDADVLEGDYVMIPSSLGEEFARYLAHMADL